MTVGREGGGSPSFGREARGRLLLSPILMDRRLVAIYESGLKTKIIVRVIGQRTIDWPSGPEQSGINPRIPGTFFDCYWTPIGRRGDRQLAPRGGRGCQRDEWKENETRERQDG
ncbi:hypothetical protein GWI33_011428 [Rhynchophorus ferrugineus]|uniref:Uncharacterized protein n=1 Tax=Rhynchophorus ferrugineus TaxID=354439 RepID=A0A834MN88_RHYFE|nr:hypothetical protein GWI33_011428 [Rhynchophorus ferrugineus]